MFGRKKASARTCPNGHAQASLEGSALYLFAIVFYWTPPHFWALSLLMREEYQRAKVPMLPVIRGEAAMVLGATRMN